MTVETYTYPESTARATWKPEPCTDRNWIQTYTGRQFWPLNPQPEGVFIEDIAHALSLTCRYTGHCTEFYSVAEHSVRVSYRAQRLYLKHDKSPGRFERARVIALCGLLHDASEAYIADVSRPVKHSATFGPIYKAIEHNLESVIARRFQLPVGLPVVKRADNELLATECRDLMVEHPASWALDTMPLDEPIEPWTALCAEAAFLYRFHALNSARKLAAL